MRDGIALRGPRSGLSQNMMLSAGTYMPVPRQAGLRDLGSATRPLTYIRGSNYDHPALHEFEDRFLSQDAQHLARRTRGTHKNS